VENGGSSRRAALHKLVMRIDINLASQPYQDSRRFWSYWGTGLALLGLITALLLYFTVTGCLRAGQDRKQMAKLNAEITAYDQERSRSEAVLNQPQNRTMREQSRFLNDLFQRKAFSWTMVFEDLERVMPAHLHVVSIRPDAVSDNNAEIKLTVGGSSLDQALDLIKKMEGSKRFKDTKIEAEKFAGDNQQHDTDPVQFDIVTSYVAGAAAEPAQAKTSSPQTSGGMF
jgi:type IV pilus assembly protein PilN